MFIFFLKFLINTIQLINIIISKKKVFNCIELLKVLYATLWFTMLQGFRIPVLGTGFTKPCGLPIKVRCVVPLDPAR